MATFCTPVGVAVRVLVMVGVMVLVAVGDCEFVRVIVGVLDNVPTGLKIATKTLFDVPYDVLPILPMYL
jgi:hypothetical protein